MDKSELISILKTSSLFWNIDNEQLESIVSQSEVRSYEEETVIIHENEMSDEVYLVLEGTLKVIQKNKIQDTSVLIAVREPGELIGELSLIDSFPRSASLIANKGLKLLRLPFKRDDIESQEGAYKTIFINLSKIVAQKLRQVDEYVTNQLSSDLEQEKHNSRIGSYFTLLLSLLSIWTLSILYSSSTMQFDVTHFMISWTVALGVIVGTLQHINSFEISYKFYGLSFENWKRNIRQVVIFTIPLIIWVCGIKLWFSFYYPQYNSITQLNAIFGVSEVDPFWISAFALIYILFIPIQEVFLRGVLQTSLKSLLKINTPLWSIILPNLLFSLVEANFSLLLPLITFIPGCFFGWIRERQGVVFGAIISHVLFAGCFFILFWG